MYNLCHPVVGAVHGHLARYVVSFQDVEGSDQGNTCMWGWGSYHMMSYRNAKQIMWLKLQGFLLLKYDNSEKKVKINKNKDVYIWDQWNNVSYKIIIKPLQGECHIKHIVLLIQQSICKQAHSWERVENVLSEARVLTICHYLSCFMNRSDLM